MRIGIVVGVLCAIAAISSGIYFAIPDAVETLSFSGTSFLAGDVWRVLSFPFVHLSASHLLQNLLAMIVIILLAVEISILGHHVAAVFFGASLLIAMADLVAFPWLVIAGASVGIYALFGALAARGSGFLSSKVMIPLLGVPLLVQLMLTVGAGSISLASAGLHIAGFVIGVTAFLILGKLSKTKIRILEVASS